MIFKLVKPSECTLFCKLLPQTLYRNIHASEEYPVKDIKFYTSNYHGFSSKTGRRIRKVLVKVNQEHIKSITAVLKRHNIDTSNLDNKSKIFRDTPWGIEKKIMLLQELGASNITTKFIALFHRRLELQAKIFKKYILLNGDKPLAENLFSHINNCNIDFQQIGINEEQLTKIYLHRCLIHFIKVKLDLNKTQIDKLENRNDHFCLFNSFRLLTRVLQFLQNDVKLSKNRIVRHHVTLLSLHPDQLLLIYNLVAEVAKDRTRLIAQQYPPVFTHNFEDLKIIVSFLKKHVLFSEKVVPSYLVEIFQITSMELKRRFDFLSKNCYTQNFLKHPRFINLIALYHRVLPRLQYLEEQNLQYATIESLTKCFRANRHEDLATFKSMYAKDLQSFFHVNFGNDAEKALQTFKKHLHYRFVPLLSMRKSLDYLRRIFSDEIIKENSYAILYNELDLQAAYEIVMKNPDYCRLPVNQLLSMCLYQIEMNNNFTGVLTPGKYAETLKVNVNQDEHISVTKDKLNNNFCT